MSDNKSTAPHSVTIRHEFKPGDAGRLIELHGILYSTEHGFDYTFEAYVARPLAEFMLGRSDREQIWLVELDGILLGSIAIVKHSETEAQLRWFLLHPSLRGRGLGTKLVGEAVQFCRECGYENVFLWTVSSLDAAARGYRNCGFHVTEEQTHTIWGRRLTEQRYDFALVS